MAEIKLINLRDGSAPYALVNPELGPNIVWHSQKLDVTAIDEQVAKRMADDPTCRYVVAKEGAKDTARTAAPAKPKGEEQK